MKDFQTFPNTKEIINILFYSFFFRLSISPQEISEKVKKSLSRERVVVSQSSPQHPKNRDAPIGASLFYSKMERLYDCGSLSFKFSF